MEYEHEYVEAMANGDEETMHAIERINRKEYNWGSGGLDELNQDKRLVMFGNPNKYPRRNRGLSELFF